MNYELFLFDADDTLFDFGASEKKSFYATLSHFGINSDKNKIYSTYRTESEKLWRLFELGQTTKDYLQIERFRKTIDEHNLQICSDSISKLYLEILPEQFHLNDYALEICKFISERGEVGIITNGIEIVQKRRLEKSGLLDYICFMVVSEECGFVKPDIRFFEYTLTKTNEISKDKILVIGDRIETDIIGAHNFGLDACWYNPQNLNEKKTKPKFQISHLSQLEKIVMS